MRIGLWRRTSVCYVCWLRFRTHSSIESLTSSLLTRWLLLGWSKHQSLAKVSLFDFARLHEKRHQGLSLLDSNQFQLHLNYWFISHSYERRGIYPDCRQVNHRCLVKKFLPALRDALMIHCNLNTCCIFISRSTLRLFKAYVQKYT